MIQPNEMDGPTTYRSFADLESSSLLADKQFSVYQEVRVYGDFVSLPRRERIDSEDFNVPLQAGARRHQGIFFSKEPTGTKVVEVQETPQKNAHGGTGDHCLLGLEVD